MRFKPIQTHRASIVHVFKRGAKPPVSTAPKKYKQLRRISVVLSSVIGGCLVLAIATLTVIILLLSRGPIEIPGMRERVSDTLQRQFDQRGQVSIGRTFLAHGQHGPTLRIENFVLKDNQNRTLISAPGADISVAPLALLTGRFAISGLEFSGLDMKLAILPDGNLAISAGEEGSIQLPAGTGATSLNPADIVAAIFAVTAQEAPFLGEMQRVGLTNGRLDVEDRRIDSSITFTNLNLSLDRLSFGGVHLLATAKGDSGPFSIDLHAHNFSSPAFMSPGQQAGSVAAYGIEIDAKNLPVHDLMLAAGMAQQPLTIAMPLSANVTAAFQPDGQLSKLVGKFSLDGGYLEFDDPEATPILVDRIFGRFNFDPATRQIVLPNIEYMAGLTHFIVNGQLSQNSADQAYRLSLSGANAVIAPERATEKPIAIDTVTIEASVPANGQVVHLDKFALKGPEIDASMAMNFSKTADGPAVSGSVSGSKTRFRTILRLWPSFVAAEVLKWMQEHVNTGQIDHALLSFDLDAQNLAAAKRKEAIVDSAFNGDIAVSGAVLTLLPGLPPISAVEGLGHLSGTTTQFIISKGMIEAAGHKLNLTDTKFLVPDTRPQKLIPASLIAHVQGNVDSAVDILQRDALRRYNNIPGEPAQYKGQLDGTVDIAMKLGKTATPDDISVKTNLQATNLSIDKVLGAERLDAANLVIATSKAAMSVKGDGRMFGAPVALELKKIGTAPTDASLTFTIDEAARLKRGFDFGIGLSGPMLIKATTQLADGERPKTDPATAETRAQIDIDLSKTSIDGLLPGWIKLAGRPGRTAFSYIQNASGVRLEQFQLDAGNANLRGTVQLGVDLSFASAKFSSFKLSPQDDLKLDIEKDGSQVKLSGRAGTLDARPFISDLLAHSRAKSADGLDYDLDLKIANLIGFNKEKIDGLDLKLRRRSSLVQKAVASGKLGGQPFKIVTADAGDQPTFTLTADNAGALLSFLDMYKRMEGGAMNITFRPTVERITGNVQIRNFVLNDEPAIRPLMNQNNSALGTNEPNRVHFSRLQGNFDRSDGRIDLNDAAMFGPQIGATMQGVLDYGRDTVDLAGNLIPAYQLNNLFSKIPLFGPLLGGGKNEGLFAINYRITGKVSAPILRVDPLSAIAPGILRKIMGVADGTQNNPSNLAPPQAPQPPILVPNTPTAAPLDLRAPQ
eukprot:gene11629-11724_t